jgi:hypothetical protein
MKYTIYYYDEYDELWNPLGTFIDIKSEKYFDYYSAHNKYSLKQIRFVFNKYLSLFSREEGIRIEAIY